MRTKTNRTKSLLPSNSGVATYSGSNRYVPGAGVGAVSSSVRRAKIRFATGCSQSGANCGAFYLTLGNDKLPIIPSLPAVPTITSITPNNEALTVSFTPGVGGGTVTNYAYSINGSGGPFIPLSPASVASPFIIGGLENGEGYDVCIVALSSSSASSAPSNIVEAIPARVPDAPTSLVATRGNTTASISFTPGYDGGSVITNYLYSIDNGATFQSAGTTVSPIVITGLTNGVTYLVRLRATNEIGNSSSSSTVSVVPATVPGAPTSLVAAPGKTAAYIYFTPGANGGSVITDYLYSIDNGITFQSAGTTVSPIEISGLTLGNTYPVQLKATNAVGAGNSSSTISVVPVDIVQFTTAGSNTWIAPPDIEMVEYLVVGGGGGSGGTHDNGGAGGGGGGMVLADTDKEVAPGTSYNITVGDGGAGGGGYPLGSSTRETNGSSGQNSVFHDVIALGGGFGYSSRVYRAQPSDEANVGGPGTKPSSPATASTGGFGGSTDRGGGGGGGDSADGRVNPAGTEAGEGGDGTTSAITGTSVTYGAGGDGGRSTFNDPAVNGAPNTGNGAKGPGTTSGSGRFGANGGSGIVVIKYL